MASRRIQTTPPVSHQSRSTQYKVALLWVKRISPVYRLLCTNVLREVCQFLAFRALIVLWEREKITVFDPLTTTFRIVDLRARASLYYSRAGECVCIDEDQVFLCGGCKQSLTHFSAFTMLLHRNQVKSLSTMKKARRAHGLYCHEPLGKVYVFSGRVSTETNIYSKSCEQYDINTDSWSLLPNMIEGMNAVSTCGYKGRVFLAGMFSGAVEVYTIDTQVFSLVPINTTDLWNPAVIVAWGDKLALFNQGALRVYDANTYALELNLADRIHGVTKSFAVVDKTLFSLNKTKCITLNLATMRLGPSYLTEEGCRNMPLNEPSQ